MFRTIRLAVTVSLCHTFPRAAYVRYPATENEGGRGCMLDAWRAHQGDIPMSMRLQMMDNFAVFHSLLGEGGWTTIPEFMHPILVELGIVGRRASQGGIADRGQPVLDLQQWVYSPMFDGTNQLAHYEADKYKPRRNADDCTKFVRLHQGLSEGLLVASCPHRICVAFQILSRHEGPRIAFELIYQRFKDGPKLIVYDNVSMPA